MHRHQGRYLCNHCYWLCTKNHVFTSTRTVLSNSRGTRIIYAFGRPTPQICCLCRTVSLLKDLFPNLDVDKLAELFLLSHVQVRARHLDSDDSDSKSDDNEGSSRPQNQRRNPFLPSSTPRFIPNLPGRRK